MIFFQLIMATTALTFVVESQAVPSMPVDKCIQTANPGCRDGQEQDGLLCYPICRNGYKGVGPVCWENKGGRSYGRTSGNTNLVCPDGFQMMQVGPQVLGCGKKIC